MAKRTRHLAPLPNITAQSELTQLARALTAGPLECTTGALLDLLYKQRFAEARKIFASWESRNPEDPFGHVAMAASYLFEELCVQGVLTSDFFLDDKKFLHGIDGRPNPERMSHFGEALARARDLAKVRQKTDPHDAEALFALTLAAGMESDAESILQKRHMDGLKRMKEANKYAECLLANYPEATDAYIALGIANYVIGSQNAGARFVLRFDGVRVHGNGAHSC